MTAKQIPEGYGPVTPYQIVPGVARLIDILVQSFGAVEALREIRPEGSIRHAEVRINRAPVMLGEPTAEFGPMPASLYLYVADCDGVYEKALEAGGISLMSPTDMPSGERYGGVREPSDKIWWIATRVEDIPPEKQARRWAEFDRES